MSLRSRFPRGDHVPPAQSSPRFEIEQIRRSDDDLDLSAPTQARRSVRGPLIAVAVVIVAVLVILGWFLIGPPSAHGLAG
jgi:hypothetical protein